MYTTVNSLERKSNKTTYASLFLLKVELYMKLNGIFKIYFQHLTLVPAPLQDFTIPTVLSNNNPSVSEVADDQAVKVLETVFHISSFRGK